MNKNDSFRNLGPVSIGWLEEIGVHHPDDLRRIGSVPVWLEVKRRHKKASLNLLWGLEGALLGCDWREIPDERKRELRAELNRR